MRTPAFWEKRGILSSLLLPIAWLYASIARTQARGVRPVLLPVPVICIGNATAGGAGKTPVALHIGALLRQWDAGAFFLSRGYKGEIVGPLLVDATRHTAAMVGDEPLLLATMLPTVVAKDRVEGALFAVTQGARVLVMDDGLQNPSLVKTLSLLVVDGTTRFGNERLIPAGPLREPVARAMAKAQGVVVINPGHTLPKIPASMPVYNARSTFANSALFKDKTVVAFCGLAYPQKFFTMLEAAGATLVQTYAFADHHTFTRDELTLLLAQRDKHSALLVTTAKDAARLPAFMEKEYFVAELCLEFDADALLEKSIRNILTTP